MVSIEVASGRGDDIIAAAVVAFTNDGAHAA